MTLSISSPAFEDGGLIPARYTCNGEDVSPPIEISGVPDATLSLALIFDDPDAARVPGGIGRTWDHWILFNIPSDTRTIPEGSIPPGAVEGPNDFGPIGYGGPCPPSRHRYYLRLYALDTVLDLKKGASRGQVESAMAGHILDSATTYTGVYEQPKVRR